MNFIQQKTQLITQSQQDFCRL